MSILWLIIKVILFVLLGIVVILITGLTIILLAPICYEAYVEKYDKLIYDMHISYLRGIKGIFYLENGVKNHKFTVFGKVLYEDKEVDEEGECPPSQTKASSYEQGNKHKAKQSAQMNRVPSGKSQRDHEELPCDKEQSKQEALSKKIIDTPLAEDLEHIVQENAQEVREQATQKIKEMPFSGIKEILLDPLTYRAVKLIIRGIWHIFKVIAPKEWDFEVVVGTGDPGDTGELIAKLTMLYPIFYQHGIIRGDYENECLMGGALVKGKFRLGQIVIRLVKLYLQKDVRAFIHLILK